MTETPYQLFDPLTDEEFAALKEDIAEHGILVPVEVDEDGSLLDGHHRARAWGELTAEGRVTGDYPTIVRSGMTEQEKRIHVRKLNLLRRQLTREQKQAHAAAMRADGVTLEAIARTLGVSVGTVHTWCLIFSFENETLTNARGQSRPTRYAPRPAGEDTPEAAMQRGVYDRAMHDLDQVSQTLDELAARQDAALDDIAAGKEASPEANAAFSIAAREALATVDAVFEKADLLPPDLAIPLLMRVDKILLLFWNKKAVQRCKGERAMGKILASIGPFRPLLDHVLAHGCGDDCEEAERIYQECRSAASLDTAELKAHPATEIIPWMTAGEYAGLRESIRQNGQLVPIVVDSKTNTIIDGRSRYKACLELGIEPRFVERDIEDPESYVISANVLRQHLTEGQRAMAAARLSNAPPGGTQ